MRRRQTVASKGTFWGKQGYSPGEIRRKAALKQKSGPNNILTAGGKGKVP